MSRISAYIIAFFALCSCAGTPLRCNYSSADISTVEGEHVILAGFAAREGLSDGVHIPLRTHALAFTDGEQTVCVISNDLMEMSPALTTEMRQEISRRSGLPFDNILIHNIHTHSAPRMGGVSVESGAPNEKYRERTCETIISNAVKVITDDKAFRAFTLETAKGTTDINVNRCEAGGPVDHGIYAARLLDRNGDAICAFFNLACHPVSMGHKSLLLSSDYSGVARREISELWGCEVFQLTGAAGNMDPEGGCRLVDHAEDMGARLFKSLSALEFTEVRPTGKMSFTSSTVELPYSIDKITLEAVKAHADELVKNSETDFPRFASDVRGWEKLILSRFETGDVRDRLDFNLAALNVDGVIFFFTQGEPFCEYQMTARKAFPDKTIFFSGYTGGQNSYLPSEHAYKVRKGYEYEIEQMHVYIKAPYPLSENMPGVYEEAVFNTIASVAGGPSVSVIPQPASVRMDKGRFSVGRGTNIYLDTLSGEMLGIAGFLNEKFSKAAGFEMKIAESMPEGNAVLFMKADMPSESYVIDVKPDRIVVDYGDGAGAFYALQTLFQLLPSDIWSDDVRMGTKWTVPCCRIEDAPRFKYRGMHLDVCLHFFDVDFLKKYIDVMAAHKVNRFHWHLTEDQGWRLEIMKYPLLTEKGQWRKETVVGSYKSGVYDGTPHGGFYTQEQVKELVRYAAERYVTIVPEIELPGHALAAISCYPELSCGLEDHYETATRWGIFRHVYCPKESTFEFLEDVFDEVIELFPSEVIHIGGDECPKHSWKACPDCQTLIKRLGLKDEYELQSYFVSRMEKYINSKGRQIIGWDEILQGGLAPNAKVMSWLGEEGGIKAAQQHHEVVMSPHEKYYLDYWQADPYSEPLAMGGPTTLKTMYEYEPVPAVLTEEEAKYIIGVEGCVWTEYMPTPERVEYMAWPRMCAIAETGWTEAGKNWDSFIRRLDRHFERLDGMDVGYCNAFYNPMICFQKDTPHNMIVTMSVDAPDAEIHYTLDGSQPTAESPEYDNKPFVINKSQTLTAVAIRDGRPIGDFKSKKF